MQRPGDVLDGFLVESALILQKRYTVFMRVEHVDAHELLHDTLGVDPALRHANFPVGKISVGGIYDIPLQEHMKFGAGALISKFAVPGELMAFYGSDPTSYMVFVRLKVSCCERRARVPPRLSCCCRHYPPNQAACDPRAVPLGGTSQRRPN